MTRTDTPPAWDERSTLLTMLQYTRDTAVAKCEGLSDRLAGSAPVPTSPLMTVGGVLNHLRWVEHSWIEHRFVGGPDLGPWTDESPDQEFIDGAVFGIEAVIDGYRQQAQRTDTSMSCANWPTELPVTDEPVLNSAGTRIHRVRTELVLDAKEPVPLRGAF
jgi:hypothetical protein